MMAILGMLRIVPSWCYWILALVALPGLRDPRRRPRAGEVGCSGEAGGSR
jgi:hypothetical protein